MSEDSKCRSVLSWDIGMKNLSYCILERKSDIREEDQSHTKHGYYIKDWGLIDLFEEDVPAVNYCCGKTKKGTDCNKKAKYNEDDKYYCKAHKTEKSKLTKKVKRKKRTSFEYAKRINQVLDESPKFLDVNYVVVENQPSQLNPIMKSIQMIIFSYFSFQHGCEKASNLISVNNVNPRQKEKLPPKDDEWTGSSYENNYLERVANIKDRYKKRKLLCLEYAKFCLRDAPEYLAYLDNHKKQDDLTDSFLQATDWLLRQK